MVELIIFLCAGGLAVALLIMVRSVRRSSKTISETEMFLSPSASFVDWQSFEGLNQRVSESQEKTAYKLEQIHAAITSIEKHNQSQDTKLAPLIKTSAENALEIANIRSMQSEWTSKVQGQIHTSENTIQSRLDGLAKKVDVSANKSSVDGLSTLLQELSEKIGNLDAAVQQITQPPRLVPDYIIKAKIVEGHKHKPSILWLKQKSSSDNPRQALPSSDPAKLVGETPSVIINPGEEQNVGEFIRNEIQLEKYHPEGKAN